jgi:hypothetical protein
MNSRQSQSGSKIYRSTFTYFIPAPPHRKTGYREVEFDKIMRGILESGFELESLATQTTPTGIFLIATLKTKNKKVFEADLKQDIHDRFRLSHTHSSPDIILDEDEDV